MTAPTKYYVNPTTGTDDTAGGRGASSGDPWATRQFALDNITRDATNGDWIIGAGGVETLGKALDKATYGTATSAAPLWFDGGAIDGASLYELQDTVRNYTSYFNLTLTNFTIVHLGESAKFINNSLVGFSYLYPVNNGGLVMGCFLDNPSTRCILGSATQTTIINNILDNRGVGNSAINASGDAIVVEGNVILVDGAANGVEIDSYGRVWSNSIWSNAGTGTGIKPRTNAQRGTDIRNNIVSGFSGVGGIGISYNSSEGGVVAGNAVYNCTTKYSAGSDRWVLDSDNESITVNPFTDATNRDMTPIDTGNIIGGAYPTTMHTVGTSRGFDKGAIQAAAAAGGLLRHPGMSGGING